MLAEHKSDPNYVTITPGTRKKRKLRKQKTTISRQSSSSEYVPHGYSLQQFFVNTKSAVQGIGYNVRSYLFDDSVPLIVDDVCSRVWLKGERVASTNAFRDRWERTRRMTYRKNLGDPILNPRTNVVFDSDTGWGCTIRSGQMMLAEVISRVSIEGVALESLFLDCEYATFSLHQFVHAQSDKFAGDWFGPTSVSLVIRKLLSGHPHLGLGVVVSLDGRVGTADILEQASGVSIMSSGDSCVTSDPCKIRASSWDLVNEHFASSPRAGFVDLSNSDTNNVHDSWVLEDTDNESCSSSLSSNDASLNIPPSLAIGTEWVRPVLVLIALRLSPENEIPSPHLSALMSYMTLPSFVGILGGPERRCHYIAGLLEEKPTQATESTLEYTLLAIDPHIVQESVITRQSLILDNNAFQNSANPTRISPACICPSIAIGFLLRCQADLDLLQEQLDGSMSGGFIEVRQGSEFSSKGPSSLDDADDVVDSGAVLVE